MGQLIQLTATKRNSKTISEAVAFDIDDIARPIGGSPAIVYSKEGNVNSPVAYTVSETLTAIAAKSPNLVKLEVLKRSNRDVDSEDMVFNTGNITGTARVTGGGGTSFIYLEEGGVFTEYEVAESIAAFITAISNDVITPEKLVFVDDVNGDNATAVKYNRDKKYKTITAAKTAAVAGDTIIVLPGTYNEKNLLKNGVDYFFHIGAVVDYTGSADGAIFDDSATTGSAAYVISRIMGYGQFSRQGTGNTGSNKGVVYLEESSSVVYIECHDMYSIVSCIQTKAGYLSVSCVADIATSGDYQAIYLNGVTSPAVDIMSVRDIMASNAFNINGAIHCKNGVIRIFSVVDISSWGGGYSILLEGTTGEVIVKKANSIYGEEGCINLGGASCLMKIHDAYISSYSLDPVITMFGSGKLFLNNCRVVNSYNSATSHGIHLFESDKVILNNVVIVLTGAAAKSIHADAALTYKAISNISSNKAEVNSTNSIVGTSLIVDAAIETY